MGATEDPPSGGALRPPNIVLVLADDLGWGSVGSYGADPALVRTPSIDRIAAEGVLFLDASTPSSICSPTRYSLLAGRYAWRTRLQSGALGIDSPLLLDAERPTLASVLQRRGYRTAMIGKWHLGYGDAERVDYTAKLAPGPLELGFDHQFAVPSNHGDITGVFVEDHGVYGLRSGRLTRRAKMPKNFQGRRYLGLDAPQRVDATVMETLTEKAVSWIEDQEEETPFFLLFSLVAVHRPITPSATSAGTSAAGPYGDWIHDVDLALERILDALDRLDFAEETLLLFTSDNGGVVGENRKLEASRASREGLAINGAFRGGKRSIYEGGFRVPLVARWPGAIPAGSVRGEMVGLVDLFATLAEAAGAAVPVGEAEDSVSFLPVMLGQPGARQPRGSMIVHAGDGNFAVRWGRWKWIEGRPDPKRSKRAYPRLEDEHRSQLFDLLADPGEAQDLSARYPDVVTLMRRLLARYRGADVRQDLIDAPVADIGRDEQGP